MKRWLIVALASVLLASLAGIWGFSESATAAPANPMKVDLSISNAPALNEIAELTCTITSHYDAPNVTAEIILDNGLELVAGDLVWECDLAEDTPIQFKVTIKSITIGDWIIQAKAGYSPREGDYYTDGSGLYISVGEDSATVSRGLPESEGPQPARKLDPDEIPDLGPSLVDPLDEPPEPRPEGFLPGSPGTLKVTGKWWCYISEDKIPPAREKRSDEMVPMVWGGVHICDGNNNLLGVGITDFEGEFEIYIENPGPDVGFYVKTKPHTGACRVTKANWFGYDDYWSQTSMFYPDSEQTEYDIEEWGIPDQWEYRGAWRIYETIVNDYYDRGAWDFLMNEGPGWTPPEIAVRFPTNVDDTSYYRAEYKIHIEGLEGAGMQDDRTKALDAVQHEYGHAVMHQIYNGGWPFGLCPSPHFIKQESGLGCAWREGWAEFFPLAVQSYDRWDDAVFEWGTGGQLNLELTWEGDEEEEADKVEGRVAGALWDIYDDVPDDYDQYHGGFDDIWDTISNQIYHYYDSFADFWDVWRSKEHNQDDAVKSIYQNKIHYYVDWDVNCDDHVNVLDTIRVGQKWGETGPYDYWIPEDVKRDGNINVLDMILIGQHWTG